MIYLHCEVFICDQASKDQRCRSGCGVNRISDKQKRDIKKSASVPEPSRNFILDNGPIQKAVNKNASKSHSYVTSIHLEFSKILLTNFLIEQWPGQHQYLAL